MVAEKQTSRLTLDPRTKMVLGLLGAALVVMAPSMGALVIICALLLVLTRCAGPFGAFWRWLRWVLPMALFFGLVSGWALTPAAGLLAGVKLLTFMMVGYAFFVYTPSDDLANALVKSGLPYPVAFVVSAGLQFVPVLGRKGRDVLDAQQARGVPITGGWRAVRHYPAFLTPLLIQAFQLAEELAEAMESRGFGRPGRSFYKEFKLKSLDWGVMLTGLLVVVLAGWGMN